MSTTSLLVLKADTLGDLVLFTPAIRALRAHLPGARIRVIVREAYLELGPLMEPGVDWIGTSIDPFTQGPEACRRSWRGCAPRPPRAERTS